MIRVLFVCHGNICRSPMAEFVLRDMIRSAGYEDVISVSSAATSAEEIGNPVHPGTRRILARAGISCEGKTAIRMSARDYDSYDYLIGMDAANIRNMVRIAGGDPKRRIRRLLDYTKHPGDISDPWYTGDFEATWRDVTNGCESLLGHILAERAEEIMRLRTIAKENL